VAIGPVLGSHPTAIGVAQSAPAAPPASIDPPGVGNRDICPWSAAFGTVIMSQQVTMDDAA